MRGKPYLCREIVSLCGFMTGMRKVVQVRFRQITLIAVFSGLTCKRGERVNSALSFCIWLLLFQLHFTPENPMWVNLKMISSPYCEFSQPNVYKHYKRLTRWNANRYYSLKITYLIFETFQTIFPTASLIFTAVRVFIKWYIKKNEA